MEENVDFCEFNAAKCQMMSYTNRKKSRPWENPRAHQTVEAVPTLLWRRSHLRCGDGVADGWWSPNVFWEVPTGAKLKIVDTESIGKKKKLQQQQTAGMGNGINSKEQEQKATGVCSKFQSEETEEDNGDWW